MGAGHGKRETEVRGMRLQAKEGWGHQKLGGAWKILP